MEIGINSMSMSRALQADFAGTIARLHAAGCDYIEGMSDWGAKPETIAFYAQFSGGKSAGWNPDVMSARRGELEKYGMRVDGLFVFDETIAAQAEALGRHCAEAGVKYIVFTFLKLENLDAVYEKIALLRAVAAALRPYGVQVMLHNHESDFASLRDRDGAEKPIVRIFTEQTRPEELMLEVDVGWVFYAGVDVAAFVRENADRIAVLHLKDIHPDYRQMHHDTVSVPCGAGAVDFPAIFAAVPPALRGKMRLVLDQDASAGDILEDHAASIRYLRSVCDWAE